jgi:O-glycosyl hydrolase/ankyrin repeat protein/protocatechuate 3,4-dioxygenase beta subunit
MSHKHHAVVVSSPASIESLETRRLLSHSANVTVDSGVTFQTIDGLGASIKGNGQPAEYLSSGFYDKIVNDLGATMVRGVIWPTFEKVNDDSDPNHFNWSAFDDAAIAPQMEFFKHMKERGATKFVVSVWTPPYWMKTNRSLKDGGVLRPDMRDEYAEYLSAFVIAAKRDFGIDISGVSLQNEPLFVEPYESTVYNPNQMRELVRSVDKKFKAEGLTTNIMIPEDITFTGRTQWWIGPTMADTTTKNFQGVIAGHSYFKPDSWTDLKNNVVNKYGRKVWMTESSNNAPTWAGAITVGQDLYNALSLGNASAWLYWQFSDNSSNSQFSLFTDGNPNPKYYAAKQYYHYIRPGSQRVSATSSDSNLLVTSVKNNPGGGKAIVLVNKGADDATTSFTVKGTSIPSSYRMIRSSATENSVDLGTVSAGSNFSVTIPANSIVTLFSGPDLTPGTGTGAQKVTIQNIFDSANASKLSSAATKGDLATVQSRISAGDNVNQQMWDGWTALDSAAAAPYINSKAILDALLAAGANPNLATTDGITPLMVAAMNSTLKFRVPFNMPADRVNALIKAGANVNAKDSQGRTALHWAAMVARIGELQTDADPSVVQALLGAGADRTIKDNSGKTALDYATRESYVAIQNTLKNTGSVNGSVAGSVYQDFNGNGVRDAEDTELTGVIIYDDVNNNGNKDSGEGNTKVDNAGNYIFNLTSGVTHHVRVQIPGGYTQIKPTGAYDIKLTNGQVTGGNDFALKPGSIGTGSISGTVFNDVNSDGVKQSSEQALSGFTVYNDANDNNTKDSGEFSTTSSSTGAYTFINLAPGAYKIRVIPLSGWTQTWPKNNFGWTVQLAANQGVTGDNFGLISTPGGGGGGGGGGSTGSISGTIFNDLDGDGTRDAGENGLSGIGLYNDANDNKIKESGELTATTDGSGNYVFSNLGAGSYKIRQILQSGWIQTTPANGFGHTVTLTSGQSSAGQDFGTQQTSNPPPPTGASISGAVFNDTDGDGTRDSGESGVSGITIYNDADNDYIMDSNEIRTTTDGSGNYSFTGLSSGSYKIRQILQSGWVQTTPANGFGHTITLATNQQEAGRNFGTKQNSVQTGATISGTVFNDLDGDGSRDAGENGISGITIYNDADNDYIMDSGEIRTTTDGNGNYSFTGLNSGSYKIRQILQSGWVQTTPANGFGHTITLATNQNETGRNFGTKQNGGVVTGASISGTVYNDANGNATRDAGEDGVSGIIIYNDADNDYIMDSNEIRTTTDGSGNYSFTGLSSGSYKIRQILQSGWSQTTPAKGYGHTITLATDQQETGRDFGTRDSIPPVTTGASVAGVVFDDVDADGVKDSGEAGISGRTVYVDINNNLVMDSNEQRVTTDSNGAYLVSGLSAGTYKIRQVLPSGWKQTTPSKGYAHTVTLSSNQALTDKNFGAWQSIAINGIVYNDANGNKTRDAGEGGLANFRVYLDNDNDSAWDSTETSVLSAGDGSWSFNNLNPGTYNVRIVDSTGYKRTTQSTFVVNLPPGGSTKLFGEQKIA